LSYNSKVRWVVLELAYAASPRVFENGPARRDKQGLPSGLNSAAHCRGLIEAYAFIIHHSSCIPRPIAAASLKLSPDN